MNLAHLPEQEIQHFGEHVSQIYEDCFYTNVQMNQDARRMANALKSLGIKKGDRVILQMPNCPEIIQSFIAIYALGAVVVPINYMVGDAETRFIYEDTKARAVISTMDFWPKIQECREGVDSIENVILVDEAVPHPALSYHQLRCAHAPDFEVVDVDDDDLAALIYTAGTTGSPKGVMHTHSTLLENARMQMKTFDLPSGMTSVAVLPLCHSYGIASMNYSMLKGGNTSVILKQIDIEAIFKAIEKYKATIVAAVPTLYVYMLMMVDQLKKYDISSMKYWTCGSAPLTRDTWQRFQQTFGGEIVEGWGLTEAGANNAANPLHGRKKIGSIGLPMQGTQMKVVDAADNEVKKGEQGEILISGPMIMKGYWQNPEETAKVLKDGWLYTGDIGYQDEAGYYFITDRKKDLIIKGGENIAPREIEEVMMRHPDIAEVAVIGVPDAVYGENIKAFVVPMPGRTLSEREVIDNCREILKRFKSPSEVVFLDTLPKNLVGKILRKELRKM